MLTVAKVFQARLRVSFKGLPGEGKVHQQQYRPMDMSRGFVAARNWIDIVAPRSTIIMSAMVDGRLGSDGICFQDRCCSREILAQSVGQFLSQTWYVMNITTLMADTESILA